MSNDRALETLSQDQRDVLQEVSNIGMGLAGEQLAIILNKFVTLSIPRIVVTPPNEIAKTVEILVDQQHELLCVRQSFFSHWRGEAFALFGQEGCHRLASIMGYSDTLDPNSETELLLDVANALIGACLNGIATQLGVELDFSPPSLYAQNVYPIDLFLDKKFTWSNALIVEVNFSVDDLAFKSYMLFILSEESLENIRHDLDRFLENL
jgi:chemotaxis protein CheC